MYISILSCVSWTFLLSIPSPSCYTGLGWTPPSRWLPALGQPAWPLHPPVALPCCGSWLGSGLAAWQSMCREALSLGIALEAQGPGLSVQLRLGASATLPTPLFGSVCFSHHAPWLCVFPHCPILPRRLSFQAAGHRQPLVLEP